MPKRKKKPTETLESDSAGLASRVERLERLVKEYFGKGVAELESNPDDPVVEERRYQKSVYKIHRSGAIDRFDICPHCGDEVYDLAVHKASKHPYI